MYSDDICHPFINSSQYLKTLGVESPEITKLMKTFLKNAMVDISL